MTNWRQDFELRRWSKIEWFTLSPGEKLELYEMLLDLVPDIADKNGTESQVRKALPSEVNGDLKGAAKILQLSELEAEVLGAPTPTAEWRILRREVDGLLRDAVVGPDPTDGDPSLSRKAHAEKAMNSLAQIDRWSAFYIRESSAQDRVWLRSVMSHIAQCAFLAGRHSQVAMNKPMEADAVRGKDVLDGARLAAEKTNKEYGTQRRMRVLRMKELISGGMKVDAAAAQCADEFKVKASAVRQTYYRHRHEIE